MGMNNFKRLFLSSILLCIAALSLAYVAARKLSQEHSTDEVLYHENIEQLKELCRLKYRQSLHHIAYAHHAERDSLHSAAALFHAISHSEAVQCDNCRQAIGALGGILTLPTTTPTPFSNTNTHIDNALRRKLSTHQHLIPTAIEQAMQDNNRYVARMLTWCDASEAKQILLLELLQRNPQTLPHARFRVCPTCGDISWLEVGSRYCPYCMTDSLKFIIVKYPAAD